MESEFFILYKRSSDEFRETLTHGGFATAT
jgi:hypothetical protein